MAGRGRTALVAALAAVALAAATLAAWPASPRGSAAPAPVATPVLSIRRVPAFVSDAVAAARLRQRLDAALGGRARLFLEPQDGGTRVRVAWTIEMMQRPMRMAARLAHPVLRWGHDRVVEATVHGFRRHLTAGR